MENITNETYKNNSQENEDSYIYFWIFITITFSSLFISFIIICNDGIKRLYNETNLALEQLKEKIISYPCKIIYCKKGYVNASKEEINIKGETRNISVAVKGNEEEKENNNSNKCKNKKNIDDKKCSLTYDGDVMLGMTFLGRLIMTYYSFYGLLFIYNFYIEYIILIHEFIFDIENHFFQIISTFSYTFFSIGFSRILIIPTFEFFSFPFLKFRDSLSHLWSFNYIYENKKFDSENITQRCNYYLNWTLIFIEIWFLFGLILGILSINIFIKDLLNCVILITIYSYYLIIIFCYIIIYFIFFLKRLKDQDNISSIFEKREKLPDINLMSYFINPSLKKCYDGLNNENHEKSIKKKEENNINIENEENENNIKKGGQNIINNEEGNDIEKERTVKLNVNKEMAEEKKKENHTNSINEGGEKNLNVNQNNNSNYLELSEYNKKYYLFLLIFETILFYICLKEFNLFSKEKIKIKIIFFFIFLIGLIISYIMRFPPFFRSKLTFGNFWDSNKEFKKEYKLKQPFMVCIIRLFCFFIGMIIPLLLCYIAFLKEDKNIDDSKDFNVFKEIIPEKLDLYEKKNLILPSLCYSSIFNMPITLFIPFINDAYYYNNNISSFNYPEYKHLFFNDSEYKIKPVGDLVENNSSKKNVKMIQYNITSSRNNITILSIKGTSNKKDMSLDLQLYTPSVLLNLLLTFSIFIKLKDTYSFHLVEYSLSIPYRLFFKYFIIEEYIKKLKEAYNHNEKILLKTSLLLDIA